MVFEREPGDELDAYGDEDVSSDYQEEAEAAEADEGEDAGGDEDIAYKEVTVEEPSEATAVVEVTEPAAPEAPVRKAAPKPQPTASKPKSRASKPKPKAKVRAAVARARRTSQAKVKRKKKLLPKRAAGTSAKKPAKKTVPRKKSRRR